MFLLSFEYNCLLWIELQSIFIYSFFPFTFEYAQTLALSEHMVVNLTYRLADNNAEILLIECLCQNLIH